MAELKIKASAKQIGYWARMEGLDENDFRERAKADKTIALLHTEICNPVLAADFVIGWNQADEELRADRFKRLLERVIEHPPKPPEPPAPDELPQGPYIKGNVEMRFGKTIPAEVVNAVLLANDFGYVREWAFASGATRYSESTHVSEPFTAFVDGVKVAEFKLVRK